MATNSATGCRVAQPECWPGLVCPGEAVRAPANKAPWGLPQGKGASNRDRGLKAPWRTLSHKTIPGRPGVPEMSLAVRGSSGDRKWIKGETGQEVGHTLPPGATDVETRHPQENGRPEFPDAARVAAGPRTPKHAPRDPPLGLTCDLFGRRAVAGVAREDEVTLGSVALTPTGSTDAHSGGHHVRTRARTGDRAAGPGRAVTTGGWGSPRPQEEAARGTPVSQPCPRVRLSL